MIVDPRHWCVTELFPYDGVKRTTMREAFPADQCWGSDGIIAYPARFVQWRIGIFSKKSGDFLKLDKVYEATLRLGYTSSTGDPEGEIQPYLKQYEYVVPSLEKVEVIINSFIGKIKQTPPKFSAIKINGQRAYRLARKGTDFEMPSREVEVYKIEIIRYKWPELELRCFVSSGTYIRTLAEDIGERLGTGAYLTALRRTQVGDYGAMDAIGLTKFTETMSE